VCVCVCGGCGCEYIGFVICGRVCVYVCKGVCGRECVRVLWVWLCMNGFCNVWECGCVWVCVCVCVCVGFVMRGRAHMSVCV